MPKISLIMPVYNSKKTLDYSIRSVFDQSFKDFEFIAVDDGSIDGSLEKMEMLQVKSPINFKIYHKENSGPASAREYGLNKAEGDIIGFIDSDDKIDFDYLSKMNETLEETKTNICCSRMAMHFNNPLIKDIAFKNRKRNIKYDAYRNQKIVPIMNVVTNGKLFRRDYIELPNCDFKANEDLSINYLLFAKARKISFENDATYHYIPNDKGLVSTQIIGHKWGKIKNTLFPLMELKENFRKADLLDDYYDEVEQIFIKNIFQRVDYIRSNIKDSKEKQELINTLYDFITYNFTYWKENKYYLSHFKYFEIPDIISYFKNRPIVEKYVATEYNDEDEIYNKYKEISKKVKVKN